MSRSIDRVRNRAAIRRVEEVYGADIEDILGAILGINAKNTSPGHDLSDGYRDWNGPYDEGWNDALDGKSTVYYSAGVGPEYKQGFNDGQLYKARAFNIFGSAVKPKLPPGAYKSGFDLGSVAQSMAGWCATMLAIIREGNVGDGFKDLFDSFSVGVRRAKPSAPVELKAAVQAAADSDASFRQTLVQNAPGSAEHTRALADLTVQILYLQQLAGKIAGTRKTALHRGVSATAATRTRSTAVAPKPGGIVAAIKRFFR